MDHLQTARTYAWKAFVPLSIGAVVYLVVSYCHPNTLTLNTAQIKTEDPPEVMEQMAKMQGMPLDVFKAFANDPIRRITQAFVPIPVPY